VLAAALESNRRRDLIGTLSYRERLSDPVARKIVTWAMVDVFGDRLGLSELEAAGRDLQGWPRPEAREKALERARNGGVATPGGPVPYSSLQAATGSEDTPAARVLSQRRQRMQDALRSGDTAAAYLAMTNHGVVPGGAEYAELESYAGWLALNKLRNTSLAAQHFARLDAAVKSPVSKARAAYWRGRTAEAAGDAAAARRFYEAGSEHTTTFYGQLAAERSGMSELVLTPDPILTAADHSAAANNEVFRALQLLSRAGERTLVRVFGQHLGDIAADRTQLAAYVDAIKGAGEIELSLLAYRRGAQRGIILHERGYPLRDARTDPGAAEPAFMLAITRQESQFDPRVRSHADARGMMQILPATGRETANKLGVAWDEGSLWDPDYNMRLGAFYLGRIINQFDGSYIMAAAGYNAGPSRPRQWSSYCGDPRSSSADPLDFIECVPFSETRNYIMNVMSNVQVYRARLNGGRAPFTLSQDLKRGGYGYATSYRTEGGQ
jgi:soluble lytic murein transglycosylase